MYSLHSKLHKGRFAQYRTQYVQKGPINKSKTISLFKIFVKEEF